LKWAGYIKPHLGRAGQGYPKTDSSGLRIEEKFQGFFGEDGSVINFSDKFLQFFRIGRGEVEKFKGSVTFHGGILQGFHPDDLAGGLKFVQLVIKIIEDLDFEPLTNHQFLREAEQDPSFGDIQGVT
jgi:hypothetical protein